jgi:biotin synthase
MLGPMSYNREAIKAIYKQPLFPLLFQAMDVHKKFHDPLKIQVNALLSIKTGGCPEDCGYCPQSAHYETDVDKQKMMDVDDVVAFAKRAKESGAGRVCLGAAWREVRDNQDFDRVCTMVSLISKMDMEVCCTLGMLTQSQAQRLKQAGLTAYNHNLDTSESFYKEIISTRDYQDRLNTLQHVREEGLSVCTGGIIGLGESDDDRLDLLVQLSSMKPHPESVPINAYVAVKGTPLHDQETHLHHKVDIWDMVRMVATARILMPQAMVRLSAGRTEMSLSDQSLCFLAGANSIFSGEKLLTTPNPLFDEDRKMFELLGLSSLHQQEERQSFYV